MNSAISILIHSLSFLRYGHPFTLSVVFLLCLASNIASAQFIDSLKTKKVSSFEGSHFLVGFMENETYIQPSGIRLRVMIATKQEAKITVNVPGNTPTQYVIPADQVLTLTIPSNVEMRESEKARKAAVEIASDVPVAVYAISSQYTSSDSYAIIPTTNWGQNYTVLSMPNDTYSPPGDDSLPASEMRRSEFMILAAFDGTQVQFNTPVHTEAGRLANTWNTVILNKGECYLVKAAPTRRLTGDLSGTLVRANRPIAVLSGHVRSSIPQPVGANLDSKDHLAEWLIPDQALSTEYISVPFNVSAQRNIGDYFKIVATQPNTTVFLRTERADLNYTLANAGEVLTLTGVNSPAWWVSNKPISIGQFMYTSSIGFSTDYDPAFSILPPADKFVTRCLFQTPSNASDPSFASQFQTHYVNVICDSTARYSIRLDGKLLSAGVAPEILTQKFRSSPFFWAQVPLKPGKHELECDSGTFSGTLYGMGYTDSYAHSLGFSTLPASTDTLAPAVEVSENCGDIQGVAREVVNAVSSGLAFAVVERDSTINYTASFTDIRANPNQISFNALVEDKQKDAQLFISTRDRAGNGRLYRFYYRPPKLNITTDVTIVAQTEQDSICRRVFVQPVTSRDSFTIQSVRLARGDSHFAVYSPRQFPLTITSITGIDLQFCFAGRGNGGLFLRDTILIDLGCGIIYRVPVVASTPTSSLVVTDVDFGDVRVGDSICKEVIITNKGTRTAVVRSATLNALFPGLRIIPVTPLSVSLATGDSATFRVCYQPQDTGFVQRFAVCENSLGLDARGRITGRGINTILSAVGIDFGKRRIENNADSTYIIRNDGNMPAVLRYVSQSANSQNFLHSSITTQTLILQPKSQVRLVIRFRPFTTQQYASTLLFNEEWQGGAVKQLTISFTGQGILPALTTRDVAFDSVRIGSNATRTQATVYSVGTQPLTIYSLDITGADATSFSINPVDKRSRLIEVGDSLVIPILFSPKRIGDHSARIEVQSDAQIIALPKLSLVQLTGIGKDTLKKVDPIDTTTKPKNDTLNMRGTMTAPATVLSCTPVQVTVRFRNIGTNDLRISRATVTSSLGGDSTFNNLPPLTSLKKGEDFTHVFTLQPPLTSGRIRCSFLANDTVRFDTTISIRVIVPRLRTSLQN
ncbi:MAG: choice-of-anchor D domain-containing protein, partial [Candidatus Kapabacteria bacterium]|nr:choice-of-anchor D domain-containing protein [Candidatus Kapabacteria bacterium]